MRSILFLTLLVLLQAAYVSELSAPEMDFVEDKLGASFQFRNPNEAGRCGCGESFMV